MQYITIRASSAILSFLIFCNSNINSSASSSLSSSSDASKSSGSSTSNVAIGTCSGRIFFLVNNNFVSKS